MAASASASEAAPAPQLRSAWAVRTAIGEPVAAVRVRNLQTTLGGGAAFDAWGRADKAKAQPLLVSAEVALAQPFDEAAGGDRVAADTVHYGTLSKALLASVRRWDNWEEPEGTGDAMVRPVAGLRGVLDGIWEDLTGHRLDGTSTETEGTTAAEKPQALLHPARVRALTVTLHLPKALLVGEGVSLTATGLLRGTTDEPPIHAVTARLHRLRVPVLIGVHPHERTAKQAVVADIALDKYQRGTAFLGMYEEMVLRELESSSFETLEALATDIAVMLLTQSGEQTWLAHVALEKPIAVPFADAPVVEVWMDSSNPMVQKIFS